MPDWVSHILFGLILAELLPVKRKSLVVLGALLPDFVLKVVHLKVLFPSLNTEAWFGLLSPLHTIFGAILVAILISPLFVYPFKRFITYTSIGIGSHILLDALARVHLTNIQTILFYPFKFFTLQFNWVRLESIWVPMSSLLVVYLIILAAKKYSRNLNTNNNLK